MPLDTQQTRILGDLGRKLLDDFEDNLVRKTGLCTMMGIPRNDAILSFLMASSVTHISGVFLTHCVSNNVDPFRLNEIDRNNMIRAVMMELETMVRSEVVKLKNQGMDLAKYEQKSTEKPN